MSLRTDAIAEPVGDRSAAGPDFKTIPAMGHAYFSQVADRSWIENGR